MIHSVIDQAAQGEAAILYFLAKRIGVIKDVARPFGLPLDLVEKKR